MIRSGNVGRVDRTVCLVLGASLIALPFLVTPPWWENLVARWGVSLIGLVLVATALVRFCPLYRIIGANTCGAEP